MQPQRLNLIWTSCFLLFVSSLALSQAPTTPTPPKASAKAKEPAVAVLGTIKGQVTTDDGRILGNTVILARSINGTASMKTAQVDGEGRFVLRDIPAAVYLIFATAPGYIDESIAVGEINQIPRHLIGADLKIRLVKGGVITGTVTNSKGEGLVGVPVRAAPAVGTGSVLMAPGGGQGLGETDDRGVYRIYGLNPGQYIVDAGGGGQFARFATTGFELDVPTFYPSSTYDTAVPVTVRAGEEAIGVDIRYKGAEGHSLSGKISGSLDSAAMPALSVMLAHAGTNTPVSTTVVATTDANRAYSFDGLADGNYDLSAIFLSNPSENASAASRRVTIRGSDLTGIELVMAPLAAITGSFKLEAIAPENKCDKRGSELLEIMLEVPRDDPKKRSSKLLSTLFSTFSSSLNVGGDFSVRNLEAGTYRPQISLPTEAWYLRSITAPSVASAQPPAAVTGQATGPSSAGESRPAPSVSWPGIINVRAGAKISGVSIIVGQDAAGVRGRVVMSPAKSLIPQNLRVHLVPAEPADGQNVLRYFETAVEREGNFALTNLAPGRYFVLPRISPPPATDEKPRPIALDPTARVTLRREAEAANNVLELKPCQRATDVSLPFKLNPER